MVTCKEGPNALTQGITARIRPPKEKPAADAKEGDMAATQIPATQRVLANNRIYIQYTLG